MRTLILLLIFFLTSISLFSIGDCDVRPYCIDRTFQMSNNTGTDVQYLDITNYNFYDDLKNGFTYEMRFKLTYNQTMPEKLFLAGVWGPFEDFNDSWILYINSNSDLVFEINGSATNLKDADNTKAIYNLGDSLVNTWHHVACVYNPFDESISLYVNNDLKQKVTNNQYPVKLRQPQNVKYGIQVGSTNALYNDNTNYLSFLGEMDEIRIWNKPLSEEEIFCATKENYLGTEDGLSVYYRCNTLVSNNFPQIKVHQICDATDNGRIGEMKGGICNWSQNPRWIEPEPYFITQAPNFEEFKKSNGSTAYSDTIKCVNTKTYTWKFVDTSNCAGTNYYATAAKFINGKWEWNRNLNGLSYTSRNQINNGVENTASITVDADFVGTELYRFHIIKDSDERLVLNQAKVPNANRYQVCSREIFATRDMYITRVTDFEYTADSLNYGVLIANCEEDTFRLDTFYVKDNTFKTNRTTSISIDEFELNSDMFEIIEPITPTTIQKNDSVRVIVRFNSNNQVGVYRDTLKVSTNDNCEDFRLINLSAEIRDVITIFAGSVEINSIDFGTLCVGPLVSTQA
ncbi:LamG domain-containing protein, partial [Candidatus Kapabacteria bacterium]|nr:LamG domain-containing protein [Candidatus Kapabacteria bacterium]